MLSWLSLKFQKLFYKIFFFFFFKIFVLNSKEEKVNYLKCCLLSWQSDDNS